MDVGFEIIPWEQKSKHRRLVIGLGGGATYNSEGREYTPLYDALGTSDYFLDSSYFVDFNGNGQSDGGDERKCYAASEKVPRHFVAAPSFSDNRARRKSDPWRAGRNGLARQRF